MLDDAQGYGYKTAQKAIIAFKWKHDKKAQAWHKKKKKIKKWLEENPEFDNELEDMLFQTQKAAYQGFEDAKLEVDDIQWLLDKHGKYNKINKNFRLFLCESVERKLITIEI